MTDTEIENGLFNAFLDEARKTNNTDYESRVADIMHGRSKAFCDALDAVRFMGNAPATEGMQ